MNSTVNRMQQGVQQAVNNPRQMVEDGVCRTKDAITSNPATAVYSAFGAGLGLGIGLALIFGSRPAPPLDVTLRDKFMQFFNDHMPSFRG